MLCYGEAQYTALATCSSECFPSSTFSSLIVLIVMLNLEKYLMCGQSLNGNSNKFKIFKNPSKSNFYIGTQKV